MLSKVPGDKISSEKGRFRPFPSTYVATKKYIATTTSLSRIFTGVRLHAAPPG